MVVDSADTVIINPGVEERPVAAWSVQLFPNPAKNYVNLRMSGTDFDNTIAEVYDIHGRLLQTETIRSVNTRIETGRLPAGVYFIKLNNGRTQITNRFTVVK